MSLLHHEHSTEAIRERLEAGPQASYLRDWAWLRRAPLVGKTIRQLLVEPGPVDPVRQGDKLVLHVDDPVETGAEKIVMARFVLLFRSHPIPQNGRRTGNHKWTEK